jgi:Na+/phosphate symporter
MPLCFRQLLGFNLASAITSIMATSGRVSSSTQEIAISPTMLMLAFHEIFALSSVSFSHRHPPSLTERRLWMLTNFHALHDLFPVFYHRSSGQWGFCIIILHHHIRTF